MLEARYGSRTEDPSWKTTPIVEFGIYGQEPVGFRHETNPTPFTDILAEDNKRPLVCSFDFHGTLTEVRNAHTLTPETASHFAQAIQTFDQAVANPVHYLINTGSLEDIDVGIKLPRLNISGMIQTNPDGKNADR